jgi:hypothetical protein
MTRADFAIRLAARGEFDTRRMFDAPLDGFRGVQDGLSG